jgi:hypothetical protein
LEGLLFFVRFFLSFFKLVVSRVDRSFAGGETANKHQPRVLPPPIKNLVQNSSPHKNSSTSNFFFFFFEGAAERASKGKRVALFYPFRHHSALLKGAQAAEKQQRRKRHSLSRFARACSSKPRYSHALKKIHSNAPLKRDWWNF